MLVHTLGEVGTYAQTYGHTLSTDFRKPTTVPVDRLVAWLFSPVPLHYGEPVGPGVVYLFKYL